jgi:hypothetical protein
LPNSRAVFEFGVAARSGLREVGRSYGLHAASGLWDRRHYRTIRFGGTMPLVGDLRNFDVGLGALADMRCVPSMLDGRWEGRCE